MSVGVLVSTLNGVHFMAVTRSSEDSARCILDLFEEQKSKPGDILMVGAVQLYFRRIGGYPDDHSAAIKYALGQKWIEPPSEVITLTPEGFAAI
jgi:hypothetical protein